MSTKYNQFIYCFENASMPGIYKIGKTIRTPEQRLSEANAPNTFKPPTPYTLTMAKRVRCSTTSEADIHKILSKFRVVSNREFFNTDYATVKQAFKKIRGYDHQLDKYEVEYILDKKIMNCQIYYRVYWKGYSLEESTWEPQYKLIEDGCKNLIDEYNATNYFEK